MCHRSSLTPAGETNAGKAIFTSMRSGRRDRALDVWKAWSPIAVDQEVHFWDGRRRREERKGMREWIGGFFTDEAGSWRTNKRWVTRTKWIFWRTRWFFTYRVPSHPLTILLVETSSNKIVSVLLNYCSCWSISCILSNAPSTLMETNPSLAFYHFSLFFFTSWMWRFNEVSN
jgi:hypothetical protein